MDLVQFREMPQPEQPGRGGIAVAWLLTRALENVNEARRGLRCVRPAVAAEAAKPEIGRLVDKSPVLGSQSQMLGQTEISSTAVQNHSLGLCVGTW